MKNSQTVSIPRVDLSAAIAAIRSAAKLERSLIENHSVRAVGARPAILDPVAVDAMRRHRQLKKLVSRLRAAA